MLSLNWTFSDCHTVTEAARHVGESAGSVSFPAQLCATSSCSGSAALHVSMSGTCQVFLKEKPWPQGHNRKVMSKHLVFPTWKQKSIISCHQWDNALFHNSQPTITLSSSCFFFKQFCSLWMTFLKTVALCWVSLERAGVWSLLKPKCTFDSLSFLFLLWSSLTHICSLSVVIAVHRTCHANHLKPPYSPQSLLWNSSGWLNFGCR